MRWYPVEEDLPPENEPVLTYNEGLTTYQIACWTPRHGWLDLPGTRVLTITHWSSQIIGFPWNSDGDLQKGAAQKYGLKEETEE